MEARPPHEYHLAATRLPRSGRPCRASEEGDSPWTAPRFRHPSVGTGHRPAHYSGAARPQRDRYHRALHQSFAADRRRHRQPARPSRSFPRSKDRGEETAADEEINVSRPAFELAGIFRQHADAYRKAHKLPLQQLRVMRAIEACRTSVLGGHVEKCSQCDLTRIAYNSCRNRHCPKCQNSERANWLENRRAELLAAEYFHVVFTIPEQMARIAFHNKEVDYSILFQAASETLLTIARDPKHLGAEIGFFAILHTWGQNLLHHPHLHCVVPGGGLSPDYDRWIGCKPGFFLPVRVLSRLFRRLFLEALEDAVYH